MASSSWIASISPCRARDAALTSESGACAQSAAVGRPVPTLARSQRIKSRPKWDARSHAAVKTRAHLEPRAKSTAERTELYVDGGLARAQLLAALAEQLAEGSAFDGGAAWLRATGSQRPGVQTTCAPDPPILRPSPADPKRRGVCHSLRRAHLLGSASVAQMSTPAALKMGGSPKPMCSSAAPAPLSSWSACSGGRARRRSTCSNSPDTWGARKGAVRAELSLLRTTRLGARRRRATLRVGDSAYIGRLGG